MMERIKEFFKKYKKPILIGLGILLILIIILLSLPPKGKNGTESPTSTIRGTGLQPTITKGSITQKEKEATTAAVVAKNFTEIYGSYSNQSNYSNIENSLSLLSSSYKATMQAFLTKSRASYIPGTVYEGTTTLVINTTTEKIDETAGTATLKLKTQRQESKDTQANYTIKYQDIRIDLVKEGGSWLVDDATWL